MSRHFCLIIVLIFFPFQLFPASFNSVLVHMLPPIGESSPKAADVQTITSLIYSELSKSGTYEAADNLVLPDTVEWNNITYSVSDATLLGRFTGNPFVTLVNVRYLGKGCVLKMGIFDTDFQALVGEATRHFPDASPKVIEKQISLLVNQATGKTVSDAEKSDFNRELLDEDEITEPVQIAKPAPEAIYVRNRAKWVLIGVSASVAVFAGLQLFLPVNEKIETVKRTEMDVHW